MGPKGEYFKIARQINRRPLEGVMRYRQDTKHHFPRYAHSLGYLAWANQLDPLRRFEGAMLIRLPLLKPDDAPLSPLYEDLCCRG